jgi:uncharacterized protein YjbI with pentapeptide repeats
MPFSPRAPTEIRELAHSAETAALAGSVDTWHQERQVRLTAQRVLSEHLCPGPADTHTSAEPTNDRFWPGIRLDLTGATLFDFSLNRAVVTDAVFQEATFSGDASFLGATFSGSATFDGATFNGGAQFRGAPFNSGAEFSGATFDGDASFFGTAFNGYTRFVGAAFNGDADFRGAIFNGGAGFGEATFSGDAEFRGATFSSHTWFADATFNGDAKFGETTFNADTNFDRVTFNGDVYFGLATLPKGTSFAGSRVLSRDAEHIWPEGWCIDQSGDGEHTVVRVTSDDHSLWRSVLAASRPAGRSPWSRDRVP